MLGWMTAENIFWEPCKAWPTRWDACVPVTTWIYRVIPDPVLPGGVTSFKMIFGREARTHVDNIELDEPSPGERLERVVTDQRRMLHEVQ